MSNLDNSSEDVNIEGAGGSSSTRQCFSAIPSSRRFWAPVLQSTFRLCPSMDIMVLGLENQRPGAAQTYKQVSSPTLWLHRTVTAQKLATLPMSNDGSTDVEADNDPGVTHTAWRPDGRLLACANNKGQLTLYHIEDIILASSSSALSSTIMMPDESSQQQPGIVSVISLPKDGDAPATVTGMTWAHVGRPHPSWELDQDEQEEEVFWKYRSRLVDRQSIFLPPCEYSHGAPDHAGISRGGLNEGQWSRSAILGLDNSDDGELANNTIENDDKIGTKLPTSQTPLSVLCVATAEHGLNVYLHGRFPVLTELPFSGAMLSNPLDPIPVPPPSASTRSKLAQQKGITMSTRDPTVDVVVSMNLAHILIHPRESHSLTLYSIPTLARERYTLQSVSALTCALSSHLKAIRVGLTEISDSWRSSIKPMDLKMNALGKLLTNYDLKESITGYLVQYILSGHTRSAPNLSNAIDQFFTGVQMNDQLLQRLDRSLSVSVANVESLLRKKLIGPVHALVYQAEELCGLARSMPEEGGLLSFDDALQVYECSRSLFLSAQVALSDIIEARFRLRDFVAWLRSTGSQIKAHGTAANSVQRQNAKKRRVPDSVVQRMLSYLRTKDIGTVGGITEMALGICFCQHFEHGSDSLSMDSRPSSPSSVGDSGLWSPESQAALARKSIVKLPHATVTTQEALDRLLERPQEYMRDAVHCTHVVLPAAQSFSSVSNRTSPLIAITTRLGRGGIDEESPASDDGESSFFCPTFDEEDGEANDYREWSVTAEAVSDASHHSGFVQISAFPLSWTDLHHDDEYTDDESQQHGIASSCFWSCLLCLPDDCSVVELAFYGDDGKSSLGSVFDNGTGKEQRQALALLVARTASSSSDAQQLELWIVPYDDASKCRFRRVPFEHVADGNLGLFVSAESLLETEATVQVKPLDADEYADDDETVLYAKTRILSARAKEGTMYGLSVSGSRGVGAALMTNNNATAVEMFDLEEDEFDENDDDDADEMGDE